MGRAGGAEATDAAAIARSVDEPAAFAEVFERHFSLIHRFLSLRAGEQTAGDLASETFVIAFRGGDCEAVFDDCLTVADVATGRQTAVDAYGGGGVVDSGRVSPGAALGGPTGGGVLSGVARTADFGRSISLGVSLRSSTRSRTSM